MFFMCCQLAQSASSSMSRKASLEIPEILLFRSFPKKFWEETGVGKSVEFGNWNVSITTVKAKRTFPKLVRVETKIGATVD